jgi:hypothetical protein
MKQSPRKATAKQSGLTWFYVSFSGRRSLLGAAFLQARTKPAAIRRTRFLGIHPGAKVEDVLCLPITATDMRQHVPVSMRNKLLSEAETRSLGGRRPGE